MVQTEWEGNVAFLIAPRDVTAHKRLEEELRRQAEALVEADRQKDDFLAMLAHELRNPLAPIRNATQILHTGTPEPRDLERARLIIEQQVRHLGRLIDDLLDVSRITRGKIVLKRLRIDLIGAIDPDVALLDIGLPHMDGYAVATALRQIDDLADILLVAMTGYGQEQDRRRAFEVGFDHHLIKPIDLEVLQRLLWDERSSMADPDAAR